MSINTSNVTNLCNEVAKKTVNDGVTFTRSELEDLFADTQYFNEGEEGKEKIQKQIDALEKTIKALKKEAEDLQKEIDEKNIKVDKKGDELNKVIGKINAGTVEFQKEMSNAARLATREAIEAYRKGNGESFEQCFSDALNKKTSRMSGVNMAQIKAWYAEYDAKKAQMTPIMSDIQNYLNKIGVIQTKLDNTNATINLLTKTRDNMSAKIEGAYKNVDTDSKAPIFSGAKEKLVDDFMAKYSTRNEEGGKPAKADPKAAQDKWKGKNSKETKLKPSSYEFKSMDNVELQNLNKCLEEGMIADLQANGMSNNEIMTFIMNNWNVGIKYDAKKDEWTIPKGHENKGVKKGGTAVYQKLRDFCASKTTTTGASNVNQNQMKELKDAVEKDKILEKMYNAGFTFKEMMYTMTKLFPDAGLTYDLSKQSTRNYGIVADNEASGTLYATIQKEILAKWNVGGTGATTTDKSVTGSTKYDPFTFQQGDTTYTFITDRDGDGKFDYNNAGDNELLGSKDGIKELEAYDYNGDGVIDDKDVDENGNSALSQLLVMGNKQSESISNGNDVKEYKTGANYKGKGAYTNSVDFSASYSSAADLGITSINLKDMKQGDKNGEANINGSVTANTLSMTTDGSKLDKNITLKETDNTAENLDTFYGTIAKNSDNIYSKLTTKDVDDAYAKDYNQDVTTTRNILKNMKTKLDNLKKEAGAEDDQGNFELNIDWAKFEELYGTDGKSGTYIKMVKERATNAASEYAEDEKNGINTGLKPEDDKSNSSKGARATEDALDKLHEEISVKFKEDEK